MRRVLISCSLLWLCFAAPEVEAATQCNDVYRGARIGPPPEWTFWADGSACFVRWPVAGPGDVDELLERCRGTPGVRFVHFEFTKDSKQSLCLFKILGMVQPPKNNENEESAPSPANDEKAGEADDSVVINFAAVGMPAVGTPPKKKSEAAIRRPIKNNQRLGKVVAPASKPTKKEKLERKGTRKRGCFTTIWQCSQT